MKKNTTFQPETKSLVKFLRQYNRWRRGDEEIEMPHPRERGEAFDALCDRVEELGCWIRCEDRLPEMGEIVWLYNEGSGTPWIGSRDPGEDGDWLWGNSYGSFWHNGQKWDADVEQDDYYEPTLWMRLPALPASQD